MMATGKSLGYSAVLVMALSLMGCSDESRAPQSISAATAAQRQYNVYFDVDKSGLTPEARQLIARVIAEANRDTSAKVVVQVGNTDIAGSEADPGGASLLGQPSEMPLAPVAVSIKAKAEGRAAGSNGADRRVSLWKR